MKAFIGMVEEHRSGLQIREHFLEEKITILSCRLSKRQLGCKVPEEYFGVNKIAKLQFMVILKVRTGK